MSDILLSKVYIQIDTLNGGTHTYTPVPLFRFVFCVLSFIAGALRSGVDMELSSSYA
jgi:hypothetical protein